MLAAKQGEGRFAARRAAHSSGGRCDFGGKVAIGAQRTTEHGGQAVNITCLRDHAIDQEALGHETHVQRHPARCVIPEVLLERSGIVA